MNPIKGIVSGTTNTAKEAAQNAGRAAMSQVPNPAQMAYGLGLGIGPLIRNIVDASKSKNVKTAAKPQEAAQQKAIVKQQNTMDKMTVQLALSNSLLKEIRNLQIKQIQVQRTTARAGGVGWR